MVCMNDQVVEDFLISDVTNLTGASVSESVEDMVSKVVVVDSTGQTKGSCPILQTSRNLVSSRPFARPTLSRTMPRRQGPC
ncbi:MAG: hypothetical protein ACLVLA_03210 [Acidaminococcus intestini]